MKVSATEFQNGFGRYLVQAMEEEEVIITKKGRAVAKLSAYEEVQPEGVREGAPLYAQEKRITYEEYLAIVEDTDERYELIDGELYYLASPLYGHQVAQIELATYFSNWFKGKPCRPLVAPFDVKLFNEAEKFEDDPNVVQPDILVMCDIDKVVNGKYEGTPTLVVEILSKSTRSKDMLKKMNLYMRSQVKEYLVVDPEKEVVHVHAFENREISDTSTYQGDMIVKSVVFEGLEIPIKDIFTA